MIIIAMVILANRVESFVKIGNCSDFKIYVKKALGKFTKYDAIKLLSDNLNATANPMPTANNNNKSLIVLNPGYPR